MASLEAPLRLNGGFEARAVQANICNAIPILMELRTVRQLTREEMVKGIGKINFHTAQTAKRQLNIDRTASILAKKSTKMSAREVQANICNAIPI